MEAAPKSEIRVDSGTHTGEWDRPRRLGVLRNAIERWTEGNGPTLTDVSGLMLFRMASSAGSLDRLYRPSVTLNVQGRKRVVVGDETVSLGPGQLLVTTVDLPVDPQIIAATADEPYLCMTLTLDLPTLAELATDARLPAYRSTPGARGLVVSDAPTELIDGFGRLLALLDAPDDIPILAPMIRKEILYRLLATEHGEALRELVSAGSGTQRIARAIVHVQEHVREPLDVEELAQKVGMGASTFYRQFRAVTAMSPLQYQKQVRLNEAQRLMITDGLDAASAGFAVGYESPSQFSREYKRQFGAPPARHVADVTGAA